MSYKKKNIFLIIGVVILFWISWNVAFIESINLRKKVSEVEYELANIENAPEEISRLKIELEKVKGRSDKLHSSVMEMRKNLLSEISDLAERYNLSLKSFPEYYIQTIEDIELTTSPIVLSGDFKGMVQLIYAFEKNKHSGKISSASFEVKESPRTNKRTLFLTLYVQSINL